MITTVTTSTITTVSTIAVMGLTVTVSIVAVVSLIFFLTIKELANAKRTGISLSIAKCFNIGVLPLMMAFAVIVAVKIAEVMA